MNDVLMTVDRLDDLVTLARNADDGYKKASVYAAASCIKQQFETAYESGKIDSYASEKVHNAVWSINAMIGFDTTNNHSNEQHTVWALGELMTLRNLLSETI